MKQLVLLYQVYCNYSLFYLDTPFTNGQFTNYGIPFRSLTCSGLQSDSSKLSSFILSVASLNLKNKLAQWIPNCYPLSTCTTGVEVVTMTRTTKNYSNQEDFIIRNTDFIVYFRQPSVSDNKQYTWSVTLCKGNYTIFMTHSFNSWSSGSNVLIKVGSTTIGSFTGSSSSASFSFTV